jgi:hypothetical protein
MPEAETQLIQLRGQTDPEDQVRLIVRMYRSILTSLLGI